MNRYRIIHVSLIFLLIGQLLFFPGSAGKMVIAAAESNSSQQQSDLHDLESMNLPEHPISEEVQNGVTVFASDLDDDGDMDVISGNRNVPTISWWENNGHQAFTPHVIGDYTIYTVDVADLDQDGDKDIVAGIGGDYRRFNLYKNNGNGTFEEFKLLDYPISGEDPSTIRIFDINEDGLPDIVFGTEHFGHGTIGWYENMGGGAFTPHVITNSFVCNGFDIADINQDGSPDIVAVGSAAGGIGPTNFSWFENDGAQNFTPQVIATITAVGIDIAAKDFNGDNTIDFLVNFLEAGVQLWANDGSQNFTPAQIAPDSGFSQMHVEDMNKDGDYDFFQNDTAANEIIYWENSGAGIFSPKLISDTFQAPFATYVSDMDKDGDMDVLDISQQTGKLVWFENVPKSKGSLSGAIRDEKGDPVTGVSIEVFFLLEDESPFTSVCSNPVTGEWTANDMFPLETTYIVRANTLYSGKCDPEINDKGWGFWQQFPEYTSSTTVTLTQNIPEVAGIDFIQYPLGSITGKITNEAGQPVNSGWVCVALGDIGLPVDCSGGIATDGTYHIEGLPPGDYAVWWDGDPTYARMTYKHHLYFWYFWGTPGDNLVTIVAGQDKDKIDMVLEQGGSISGKATDSQTGEPLRHYGVAVNVKKPGDDYPRMYAEFCVNNENGTYELKSLPLGWEIFVYASGGKEFEWCTGSPYGGENWKEKPDFAPADPIILTTDNPNRTNINFTLGHLGSITGRVLDAVTGLPVSVGYVCADIGDVGGAGRICSDGITDDGYYGIYGLPDEKYAVWWEGDPAYAKVSYPDHRLYWNPPELITIDPDHREQKSINFALKQGGSISGQATDSQTGEPLSHYGVAVNVKRPEDENPRMYAEFCVDNENGTYELASLPLDWEIFVYASGGKEFEWCTGSPYGGENWDEKSSTDIPTPIELTADNPNRTDINFTLDPFGSITGKITNEAGQPVSSGHVCAALGDIGLSLGCSKWIDESGIVHDGIDPIDGTYHIEGLPPGDYAVWWDENTRRDDNNPDYARMTYPHHLYFWGVPAKDLVNVAPGQDRDNINMTLEQGGFISGRAIDSGDRKPLEHYIMVVHVKKPSDLIYSLYAEFCVDNNDGAFVLEGLPLKWEIRAYAAGGKEEWCTNSLYGGEYWEERVDFELATPIILTPEDPDQTGIEFTLAPPFFYVTYGQYGARNEAGAGIEAMGWPLGNEINIEIDDPSTPLELGPDYTGTMKFGLAPWDTNQTYASFDLSDKIDVKSGFEVTLSDWNFTKKLIVSSLEYKGVDTENDVVYGVADAKEKVYIWARAWDGECCYTGNAEADDRGIWRMSLKNYDTGRDLDMVPNTYFEAEQLNDDSDRTLVGFIYQPPYIEVSPGSQWLHARGNWLDGTMITMTIDDLNTLQPVDYSDTATFNPTMEQYPGNPGDPYAWQDRLADFDLNGFVLEAGQKIVMDGGGIHKEYVIQPMTVASFVSGGSMVSGTSAPDATVQVCVNLQDHCATRYVTADSNGYWEADFKNKGTRPFEQDVVPFLQPGMTGWAVVYESDGDQAWDGDLTWADWQILIDTDNDGIEDSEDNAPNDFNPDQRDCDRDTIADVLDPCPSDATNACNTSGSSAGVIGSGGGTLTTPNSNVSLDIPAGTMEDFISFSITDTGGGYQVSVFEGAMTVLQSYVIQPHGTHFDPPAAITFHWDDVDNNGVIDGTMLHETHLLLIKDGMVITPSCAVNPKCDMNANELIVEVSDLSLFELSVPTNEPPVANAGLDRLALEGDSLDFDASASSDPEGEVLTYAWDLDNNGQYDDATGVTAQRIFDDDGTFIVGLQVTDSGGLSATDTVEITVANVSPTITYISAPVSPVQLGTLVNVSAAFTDPGTEDTFTAVWSWEDGTTSMGTLSGHSVNGTHLYTTPGVYTVKLTVTDDDGGAGTLTYQYVVVYDPTGGFVTGGGWIIDPDTDSKVHFGFNPKYQKDTTLLKGETEFKLSGITFKSTSHEWLVINGAKAQFKGSGTVNGTGNYGFLVTVIDGTPDKIRIKIWDKATGEEFYDNQPGAADYADPTTQIGGGSIQVHAK